jgi:NDP-4-keto-2,6-dideoxyhexose 3-C-methyltransferase
LDLGTLYLSDFPHAPTTRPHPPVPLTLARCDGPCGLVQLTHTTPQEWLYAHYWYRSGVNESMVAELRDVVREALKRVELPKHAVVIDIGANDGTLLQQYGSLTKTPLITVAYEPALNLYPVCRPHAKVLFPTYFGGVAPGEHPRLTDKAKAKIVTAIAMFYDLDDPHAFLQHVVDILARDGVLVIQQAYLPAMLANVAYDNICHEHLGYYDLHAMEVLLARHGLEVFDVERRAVNGGSFRTYVGFVGQRPISPRVAELRLSETARLEDAYDTFASLVAVSRIHLQEALASHLDAGGTIDLYGASTKGNTLLQYCGIDHTVVRQAWERSPEKVGRYVGVSGIPIVSEEAGRADPPSALLSTIWQFRTGIVAREQAYLDQGGVLIFPLPTLEVVRGTPQPI